ncbi:E3 ubiquitin-protein ligase RING1-like [Nymphaea thermarum]|nr:E3 ubiquitin-protein ligase RING1-like [Nymphaea thermarum]
MATAATESGKRTSAACRNTQRDAQPQNPMWVPIEPFQAGGAALFDLDEALTLPYCGAPETESGLSPPQPSPERSVSLRPTVCSTGVCAVCMEEFAVGSCGKMMPCSHVYHEECIAAWLAGGGSCPLCRCRVKAE